MTSPVHETRIALTVPDLAAALSFYRDALGLFELDSWEGPEGSGALLDAGPATIELLSPGQAAYIDEIEVGLPVSGPVRLALQVDESDTVAARLVGAGGRLAGEPVLTPWGHRDTRIVAPDGMQLTLFELV
ncbi:MAG: hypothetical protein AUI14_22650 [Actinobacteria bacterium 13_2_20CM_2_71_6]|nr:MAG: hypothetical protein AUI14_22650 [Actinobacteria bacterium 13_2_20CM_2_71_6]